MVTGVQPSEREQCLAPGFWSACPTGPPSALGWWHLPSEPWILLCEACLCLSDPPGPGQWVYCCCVGEGLLANWEGLGMRRQRCQGTAPPGRWERASGLAGSGLEAPGEQVRGTRGRLQPAAVPVLRAVCWAQGPGQGSCLTTGEPRAVPPGHNAVQMAWAGGPLDGPGTE